MNTLALATTTLSQSPSLWHAGTDLLRSKSLDRNSYDSGDWFNAIDWSGQRSNFGVGLPPERDNGHRWDALAPILRDPSLRTDAGAIRQATDQAQTLLELKHSSKLFTLGESELINEKLSFPIGGPDAPAGVIVMHIDDTVGADIDPALEEMLVIFNATPAEAHFALPELEGHEFTLSPVQAEGPDDRVRESQWSEADATVTVPARTVAVFVSEQAAPAALDGGVGTPLSGLGWTILAVLGLLGVAMALRVVDARTTATGRKRLQDKDEDLAG